MNPTIQAQTATAVHFDLLGTPTPFESSAACPEGSFSPNNLQPEWVAACIHCLPSTPTRTPGGLIGEYPFSTHSFEEYGISYPAVETSTPTTATAAFTPSVTFAPSLTFTPSPTLAAYVTTFNFDGTDHGVTFLTNNGAGFVDTGVVSGEYVIDYLSGTGGGYGGFTYDFGANVRVSRVRFRMIVGQTATIAARMFSEDELSWVYPVIETASGGIYATWDSNNYTWDSSGFWPQMSFTFSANNTPAAQARFDWFEITWAYAPTPTPTSTPFTPTATYTPTPTGTWYTATPVVTGTATPDRSFLPAADCRVPVYVTNQPIVDVDLGQSQSACYRLFPQLNIHINPINIDSPALDFCFDFYELTVNFIGLDVDIAFFVSIGIALMLVRFGLFSG